jgi:Mn2+/Fe2+ NRAMP family transporter
MLNLKNLFNSLGLIRDLKRKDHKPVFGALDIFKYIGPGLLVTVGFIDPGNWAANIATGSEFGYTLLWVVSLSTIMLIVLQHNVAHLGIATGLCLSEAATIYLNPGFPNLFCLLRYWLLFLLLWQKYWEDQCLEYVV